MRIPQQWDTVQEAKKNSVSLPQILVTIHSY
jgi:hypothetical protein